MAKISMSYTQANRPMGIVAKLFLSIFFLIFAAAGTLMFVAMSKDVFENLAVYTWRETGCKIESSEVVEDQSAPGDRRFVPVFTYQVGGKEYRSNRYELSNKVSSKVSELERLKLQYEVGSDSKCYVNPSDATQAVLHRKSMLYSLVLLFPLPFMAIGFGGIFSIWWWGGSSRKYATQSITKNSSQRGARGIGFVFFGIFAAIGGVILGAWFVPAFLNYQSSQSWPTLSCRVISSDVKSHSDSDGTTYSVNIVYEYEVDGRTLRSDTYDSIGGSSGGYDSKRDIVKRYPVGATTSCFVDPADPTNALLNREFSWTFLIGLIPLIFLLIGVGGMIAMLKGGDRAKKSDLPQGMSFGEYTVPRSAYGDVELKASSSPVGRFIGLLFFSIIWNGMVSLFGYFIYQDFGKSSGSWFVVAFISIFALIGVLMLIALPGAFLAIFNPRIKLFAADVTPRLGSRVKFRWEIDGKAEKIKSMVFSLIGEEQATYRRGTDTQTANEIFYQREVHRTQPGAPLARGEFHLEVPRETMHTFSSNNNRISWKVKVIGEIVSAPDLGEEYPITVRALTLQELG